MDVPGRQKAQRVYYDVSESKYFGEITSSSASSRGCAHAAVQRGVSPTLLVIFRSGIPLLGEQAEERWEKLKTYHEYEAQTRELVLLPKRKLPEPQHA
jgi:hypothetical protein